MWALMRSLVDNQIEEKNISIAAFSPQKI